MPCGCDVAFGALAPGFPALADADADERLPATRLDIESEAAAPGVEGLGSPKTRKGRRGETLGLVFGRGVGRW